MRKLLISVVFSTLCFFLCSCASKVPEHYVAFYLESPKKTGTFDVSRTFTLPVINKEIRVSRDPVFNIDALSDCVVSQKYDPVLDTHIPGLFFRIKDDYSIRLEQIASRAEGRKFLLVADGKPLGFCVLKKNMTRNDLFFFVMTSVSGNEALSQLDELCFELNGYILEFREYKENQ